MAKPRHPRSRAHGLPPAAMVRRALPSRIDPAQPALALDPMPTRIEPCLALLAPKLPTGADWAYEVKLDGYRLAVHVEPSGVRLLTRAGHDWTHRFPAIADAARALGPATLILDGEAVVLDGEGRSDFGLLQRALGGGGGTRAAVEAVLYAFDLLYADGRDIGRMPLAERRQMLETIVPAGGSGAIRLSEEIAAGGEALLRAACKQGLEGVVAKHRDRPYRSGRHDDWLKVKCAQSDSFAVIGYEPSATLPGAIDSLVLAARRGDALVHVGEVGIGFTQLSAWALREELDRIRTGKPQLPIKDRRIVWVKPVRVAEIEHRGWTKDGTLRHPSFKGLRDEADAAGVCRIDA
ncbi:non-homologous end-joining DNA ligase [Labrys wisconsinensis]|uniref:DNA ligase (ATP) n=1 Tax=Labrys wisconsinensis TaxID=425677 RepID=A0ABU0J635_9HYPH|nr:bifunctional non-homologous end joining protein LigD [Labrys wisconsinensis]